MIFIYSTMSNNVRKQNRPELSGPQNRPRALYIHVPFCIRKCRYCDFYSIPYREDHAGAFVSAAGEELAQRAECLATPLESVFVGGGTPTALGPKLLGSLLSNVGNLIDARTEFTVEANPCTIGRETAEILAACGANRVSLGVQSFNADELSLLGRLHNPQHIAPAAAILREAGISNISLDLIYGIPKQTPESWNSSLAGAFDLAPEHLSCYALGFEPDTPLHADLLAGRVREMDDSRQRACYEAAIAAATAAGMEHYEISNFARPQRQCGHNLTYWHNQPYLGIGPAAAGYVAGIRRTNRPNLREYISAIRDGREPPATSEKLTGRAEMAETLMLGLRLIRGIDRTTFRNRFGRDALDAFPRSMQRYAELGALVITSSRIRLAAEYLFVADTILADILAEANTPE